MPNWCDNKIGIIGSEKDIREFYKKYLPVLNFESIIPEPKKPYEVPAKYILENTGIYHGDKEGEELTWMDKHFDVLAWRRSNWGTKWDVDPQNFKLKKGKNYIFMQFLTAWAPPFPILAKLMEDNPNLKFKCTYIDENYLFAGCVNPDKIVTETEKADKMDEFLKRNDVKDWIKYNKQQDKQEQQEETETATIIK